MANILSLLSIVSAAKDTLSDSFKTAKMITVIGIAKAGFVSAGSGQTAKKDGLIVKADNETFNVLPGSFLCAMYKAGKTDISVPDNMDSKTSAKVTQIIASAKSTAPVQAAFKSFKEAQEEAKTSKKK